MDTRQTGGLLVLGGLVLVAVGALVWTGALSWFGRLPGDVRIEGERTSVFLPITSMILVSLGLSAVAWLVRRFLGG